MWHEVNSPGEKKVHVCNRIAGETKAVRVSRKGEMGKEAKKTQDGRDKRTSGLTSKDRTIYSGFVSQGRPEREGVLGKAVNGNTKEYLR